MKKYFYLLLIISFSIILGGCGTSQDDIDMIVRDLKNNNIINKSMTRIDTEEYNYWGLETGNSQLSYIYKDERENMILINIERIYIIGAKTYNVYLYQIDSLNNDITYLGETKSELHCNSGDCKAHYCYDSGCSYERKYIASFNKAYKATLEKGKKKYFNLVENVPDIQLISQKLKDEDFISETMELSDTYKSYNINYNSNMDVFCYTKDIMLYNDENGNEVGIFLDDITSNHSNNVYKEYEVVLYNEIKPFKMQKYNNDDEKKCDIQNKYLYLSPRYFKATVKMDNTKKWVIISELENE